MLPVELEIVAFGPFGKTEFIDFRNYYESDILLINGPTGAGKTSILDALCYALYGETTGQIDPKEGRAPKDMRSQFSDECSETSVRFRFKINQTIYEVKRVVGGMRAKKKGDGLLEIKPSAYLKRYTSEDDFEYLEAKKPNEVKKLVTEIIGVGIDQFRQVAILPQGKFRDFLASDSVSKENILNSLFDTYIYGQLIEAVKYDEKELNKSLEENFSLKKNLLETLGVSTIEEAKEKLDSFEKVLGLKLIEAEKSALDIEVKTKLVFDLEKRNNLEKAIEDIESKIKNMEEKKSHFLSQREGVLINKKLRKFFLLLEKEKEISIDLGSLMFKCEELDGKQLENKTRKKSLDKELEGFGDYDQNVLDKNRKIERAENYLKSRKEKESMTSALSSSEQKLASIEVDMKRLKAEEENASKLLSEMEDAYRTLAGRHALMVEKRNGYSFLNLAKDKFSRIKILESEKADICKTASQLTGEIKNAKDNAEESRRLLRELELKVEKHIASELAEKLQRGMPCLVCGSTEHPNLSKMDQISTAAKDEIELQKRKVNSEDISLARSEESLLGLGKRQEQIKLELLSIEAELKKLGVLSEEDYLDKKRELDQLIAEINEVETKRSEVETAGKSLRPRHNSLKVDLENVIQSYNSMRISIESLKVKLENLSEVQPVEGIEDENDLNRLKDDLNIFQGTYRKAASRVLELEKEISANEASKNQLAELAKQKKELKNSLDIEIQKESQNTGYSVKDALSLKLEGTELEEYETQSNTFFSELESLNFNLERNKVDLSSVATGNLEEETEALHLLKVRDTEIRESLGKVREEIRNTQEIKKKLEESSNRVKDLEKRYSKISFLAKSLSGANDSKLNLSRFALSIIFDDVLERATRIFYEMSKGRYSFIRAEYQKDKRRAFGLDLEVFDEHTGQKRPVNTLSGGEGFLGSLSLALGLSELVQSAGGGVRLDMLFIDEGFGSLDPEALSRVVDSLKQVGELAGVVGIITHVPEVKNEIMARIEVIPGPSGSRIESSYPI